eukprot:3013220-Pyramimonas_sp.AAC.1
MLVVCARAPLARPWCAAEADVASSWWNRQPSRRGRTPGKDPRLPADTQNHPPALRAPQKP